MKLVNPENPLTDESLDVIEALAQRQKNAGGILMTAITYVGGQIEDGMKLLPAPVRAQVDQAARAALEQSYEVASKSRQGALQRVVATDRMHRLLGTLSGALGGAGGLPTALAELPVATTVIFRSIQGVAESYGEDPSSIETRIECLRVFGAGGPDAGDDGVDTTFLGARLGLSGTAVHGVIAKVAPQFATVLSQKLASQAVPVLGAAAGAGTNYAFIGYYTEMAHVHFGLRAVARQHDEAEVLEAFHAAVARGKLPKMT